MAGLRKALALIQIRISEPAEVESLRVQSLLLPAALVNCVFIVVAFRAGSIAIAGVFICHFIS
jgi:hypothetical protein